MLAKDLISDVVPFLRASDLGIDALNWMEIFRVSHLPIINNVEFLGLISDTDIYDMNMANEQIGNHQLSLFRPYVFLHQHIYDIIELASRLKLTTVPVLDEKKRYIGLITQTDLLHAFADIMSLQNPGGIIVLECNMIDYSMAEISQIVEGNDAKILSMYITSPKDSTKLEITLKINRIDLTSIIQTFYRYDYSVKAKFTTEDTMETINKERYESFLNYLNV